MFNLPFFLVLDFAVGGGWAGEPDQAQPFQKQMLVDYVRVYNQR